LCKYKRNKKENNKRKLHGLYKTWRLKESPLTTEVVQTLLDNMFEEKNALTSSKLTRYLIKTANIETQAKKKTRSAI
jgi:hypothetical protein